LDTDWKENYNCNITGHGVDAYFMTKTTHRFLIFAGRAYAVVTAPITIPLFVLLYLVVKSGNFYDYNTLFYVYLIVGMLGAILLPMILLNKFLTYGIAIKNTPDKIVGNLFDAMGDGNPYLNTTGENGTWGFENNYRGIAMYMEGFYGLWVSINDGRQVPGADVKGYCHYVKAKGMDDWPWDGWGEDYPW
jgi:hypothetical protein